MCMESCVDLDHPRRYARRERGGEPAAWSRVATGSRRPSYSLDPPPCAAPPTESAKMTLDLGPALARRLVALATAPLLASGCSMASRDAAANGDAGDVTVPD